MAVFYAAHGAGKVVSRVRFEIGGRHDISSEMTELGVSRALVLTTPEQSAQGDSLLKTLGSKGVGQFSEATMHTPVDVTERAVAFARTRNADCLVAIGGGSTVGLAKAIAYQTDLPQIVLPTTYAGSEATPILGQTENGAKTTLKSERVVPEAIVYDAELITGLPIAMSVTSGLNAMAHAVEALYAQDANRLSGELALSGFKAFAQGLPALIDAPADLKLREDTLFGAWLCGTVLGQVGMALHHKLCHVLGGTLNLPHAETHAIILPHATAFNEAAVPETLAPLARLLGAETAGGGLFDFSKNLGAPTSLKSLGVCEDDLETAADAAVKNPYWNPRPVTREGLRDLLQNAFEGRRPSQGSTT